MMKNKYKYPGTFMVVWFQSIDNNSDLLWSTGDLYYRIYYYHISLLNKNQCQSLPVNNNQYQSINIC